jgi:hypothetical protein
MYSREANEKINMHEENDRLANIQLLENLHGNAFEIVTLKRANFHWLSNTKSIEHIWFPGFKWTIGLCPHCMIHIGWFF